MQKQLAGDAKLQGVCLVLYSLIAPGRTPDLMECLRGTSPILFEYIQLNIGCMCVYSYFYVGT